MEPEGSLPYYFVSQSSEFYRHNPLFCFSTSVYCCCCLFPVIDSVRKLLDTLSYTDGAFHYCTTVVKNRELRQIEDETTEMERREDSRPHHNRTVNCVLFCQTSQSSSVEKHSDPLFPMGIWRFHDMTFQPVIINNWQSEYNSERKKRRMMTRVNTTKRKTVSN
jgi:hypothetical protein